MVAVSWQQYWEAADNDMLQCCVNDKLDFVCHSIGEKTPRQWNEKEEQAHRHVMLVVLGKIKKNKR